MQVGTSINYRYFSMFPKVLPILTHFSGFSVVARNLFAGDVSMKHRFVASGNKRFKTPTRLAPKRGRDFNPRSNRPAAIRAEIPISRSLIGFLSIWTIQLKILEFDRNRFEGLLAWGNEPYWRYNNR